MASSERESAIRTLNDRLHGLEVAMLTTVEPDGSLRSRPMVAQRTEFDGDLWFLARSHARYVWAIQRNPRVNLTYSDPEGGRFVSVSGTAHILRDRAKAEELWDEIYEGWFDGLDDPELCLIKVAVECAQTWGGSAGATERIEGFAPEA